MKLAEIHSNISFVTPTRDDAEQLVRLKSILYNENVDFMPSPPDLSREYNMISILTSGNNFYKMCKDMSSVIGYCSMKEQSPNVGLFGIGILKSYNGVGIGGQLMDNLLSYASSHGYDIIQCYVHKSNTIAINMYLKLGFSIVREEDTDYIMEKHLTTE
jgi:ribosomal protein S18 acetylase RimI-like enzyme